DILKTIPDVLTFSRRTGLGLGPEFNEPNAGDFFVRLKNGGRRPIDNVMEEVDTNQITSVLNSYLEGTVATYIPQAHKQVGVRVWIPPEMKQRDSQLPDLPIRATDGHIFPLERAASLRVDTG